MSNFTRKIKKYNEINRIKTLFGKEPKHRCKDCHKMTLYVDKGVCIWCSGIYDEVEKKFLKALVRKNKKVKDETITQ